MSAVVDANLVAALVLPLPFSDQAAERIASWKHSGERLFAPTLMEYELDSVLRKAVALRLMTTAQAREALRQLDVLGIQSCPPTLALRERALHWAESLGQTKAYDAHYLALAEEMRVELWTADRRLAQASRQIGLDWVRWLGEG